MLADLNPSPADPTLITPLHTCVGSTNRLAPSAQRCQVCAHRIELPYVSCLQSRHQKAVRTPANATEVPPPPPSDRAPLPTVPLPFQTRHRPLTNDVHPTCFFSFHLVPITISADCRCRCGIVHFAAGQIHLRPQPK